MWASSRPPSVIFLFQKTTAEMFFVLFCGDWLIIVTIHTLTEGRRRSGVYIRTHSLIELNCTQKVDGGRRTPWRLSRCSIYITSIICRSD